MGLCLLLTIVSVGYSQVSSVYTTANFSNGIALNYLTSGGTGSGIATWNPDFGLGALKLGLSINIPLNDPSSRITDNIVLRYAQYDSQNWGFRYGIISNYTLGYGLLVDNYTSAQQGILQTNNQSGLRLYYKKDIYGLDMLGTWSRFYAIRISEEILPRLTIGQYYAADSDGVNFTRPDGTTVSYPSQSGFGLDASYSLWAGGSLFAEYAKLNNYGAGFTTGFNQDLNIFVGQANFRAERRFLEKNFVPGYFNAYYETNPIDIVSYEALSTEKNGYRVSLGASVLERGNFWAVLEGYEGSNTSLKAYASAVLSENYFGQVEFVQSNFVDARSLNLEEGAIITGKLGYKLNQFTNVIANYKQYYDPNQGKVVYQQWYEVSLNF